MKLIKLALASIIILFALASLVGALLPSTVLVSRAINVNTAGDSVRPYISNINHWGTWVDGMNSAAVKIYSPSRALIGTTDVDIIKITDSTVVSQWTGAKGASQISTMRLISDTVHKVTVVQWQFEQKLKWYPWEKLGSMMNDKILGTMMEKDLNNLKLSLEGIKDQAN